MVIEALIVYMYVQKAIVPVNIREVSDVRAQVPPISLVLNTRDLWEEIRAQQAILQSA